MKTDLEQRLVEYIAGQESGMLALLKEMVLIQSGSCNKAGTDQVAALLRRVLEPLPLEIETYPQKQYGDILVAGTRASGGADNILIVGHTDTVFPEDTTFNGWREDPQRIFGPGVIDMKGGLVVGVYALKALDACGRLQNLPIRFVFNTDEEVGSPVSGPLISAEAQKSVMAFVLECGGMQGEVVTSRKGRLGFHLNVTGRAGHAAFVTPGKPSAILELAHKIIQVEALNGLKPGLTVNVGKIHGGIGPNSIAESATAKVDVRFANRNESDFFRFRLDEIIATPDIPGTRVSVEKTRNRPPMEASSGHRFLFKVAQSQARKLGMEIRESFRPGASDANIIAAAGTPVLDGLGPVGEMDHSDQEYMQKDSLVRRCQLFALTLLNCWNLHRSKSLFDPSDPLENP